MEKIEYIINYWQVHSGFLRIWFITLIIVMFLSYIVNKQIKEPINQTVLDDNLSHKLSFEQPKSTCDYFAIVGFLLFLTIYIYTIFSGADFAYHDHSQFTFASLQGDFFYMPIWPSSGRFWPLGLQEYNFIALISKTPFAYHLFSVIQLIIVIVLCFKIFSPFNLTKQIIFTTVILTVPSFVISFFGLIFPERNLIFWLSIFIFCLLKKENNNSIFYVIIILISTQFLLYYKEPIFILILGFTIPHLLINIFDHPKSPFQTSSKSDQGKFFKIQHFLQHNFIDIALIILSIVFLYLYFINTQGQLETSYTSERTGINILKTFYDYVIINPILSIFLITFVFRFSLVLIRKQKINVIWDCLAIGNLLYFLAYIKLNIFRWYYTAPIDFIAILYLVTIYSKFFTNYNKNKLLLTTSLLSLILLINLHFSSYAILVRKAEIDSRVQVKNYLAKYILEQQKENNVTLFFPENSGYFMMEFASYLYYKKFPILIDKNNDNNNFKDYIIMKSQADFADNLCVSFRSFKCFHKDQPDKDDLIIFLPETAMLFSPNLNYYFPVESLKQYQQKSEQIFHYQPQFTGIRKILYFFCPNLINEQWFNAYILKNFNPD